ncbi:response regulator [Variovorax sp. RB2P76]|uniref:response regulator n=1 Tax=Variovorax sp. RB2P76 TaxID=3443736 RepID=UPI003F48CE68
MHLSTFLVEANPAIRLALVSALEDLVGARFVGYADSEESAVLWLSTHSGTWDLAVVDLFLAQGSGLGVLDACASRQPNQRVAVLTNYATNAMRNGCLARGADAFFDKSTELEQFVRYCEDF